MRICLDPGHGGKDTGALGFGVNEKDMNLDITLRLEKLLKARGFQVYMTRRKDITLPLKDRVKIINDLDCDLTLSIHNNSASSENANGSEVIYPSNSIEGKMLAQTILNNLIEIGLKKRKVYYRLNNNQQDYYYIIRKTKNLTLIIECAFITNKKDNSLLISQDFRQKIAEGIANGVITYGINKDKNLSHWAKESFEQLKNEGLIIDEHDLNSYVTWGEFVTIISRMLKKK